MLCYPCAELGTDRPAVALCRSCNAALCLDHLRATAAHFASSHMLDTCQRRRRMERQRSEEGGDGREEMRRRESA